MVVCVWSNYCHASALTLKPPAIVRLTLSSLWAHSSVSVLIGEEKAWGTLCGLSDTKIQQWGITCQYSYWVWAPQEWKNSFHLKCWIIINLTASMNEMIRLLISSLRSIWAVPNRRILKFWPKHRNLLSWNKYKPLSGKVSSFFWKCIFSFVKM